MDTAWMAAVKRSEIKAQDSADNDYQKNDNENAFAYQFDKRKNIVLTLNYPHFNNLDRLNFEYNL